MATPGATRNFKVNPTPNTDSLLMSNDRILILKPIDGTNSSSSKGLIDNRLFTGGNRLHAVMDEQTCLWSFRYDHGFVPQDLKQQWTSFQGAMKAAKVYFLNRNVEVKEVLG
jgi:hypothetical protein